jgi:hypothetical protein
MCVVGCEKLVWSQAVRGGVANYKVSPAKIGGNNFKKKTYAKW